MKDKIKAMLLEGKTREEIMAKIVREQEWKKMIKDKLKSMEILDAFDIVLKALYEGEVENFLGENSFLVDEYMKWVYDDKFDEEDLEAIEEYMIDEKLLLLK
jgi:hypothetical protein